MSAYLQYGDRPVDCLSKEGRQNKLLRRWLSGEVGVRDKDEGSESEEEGEGEEDRRARARGDD
jgi:hypothetical protein